MLGLFICLLVEASSAAPVATSTNTTQSPLVVGYISEPNVRGTASLLLSCILTLVLCVWSALHLNVPQEDASHLQSFFCKVQWIITGVYAPELVVFTAWRQWASARLLGQLVAKLSNESKEKNQSAAQTTPAVITRQDSSISLRGKPLYHSATFAERRHKWTKTHDFFASTGGFAFEIPSGHGKPKFLPDTCPSRLTLTARGVALLAKCNRLPDVSEKDILDKSKANDLAKALVVIQASWMLLQTLGRVVVGLPVTLLEVNTMAHVACVFVLYILWWHKPLLPNEPFIVGGDWVDPLCAYMYMSSDLSGEVETKESQTIFKTIFAFLNWYSKSPEVDMISLCLRKAEPAKPTATEADSTSNAIADNLPTFRSISTSKSCMSEMRARQLEKAADTAFFERRPKVKGRKSVMNVVPPITHRCWALALKAISEYPAIFEEQTLFCHENGTCVHFRPEELVVRRVQNWPSNDLLRNVGGLMVGMILWMASFAYGGIHAAAWNSQFPTYVEKWLWRASATYIGFCGGFWIILNYVAQAYRPLNEFWEGWMDGKSKWHLNILIGFLVFICGISFCAARFYIVIEAMISIRRLPAAVYLTPDWTQLFPHL